MGGEAGEPEIGDDGKEFILEFPEVFAVAVWWEQRGRDRSKGRLKAASGPPGD